MCHIRDTPTSGSSYFNTLMIAWHVYGKVISQQGCLTVTSWKLWWVWNRKWGTIKRNRVPSLVCMEQNTKGRKAWGRHSGNLFCISPLCWVCILCICCAHGWSHIRIEHLLSLVSWKHKVPWLLDSKTMASSSSVSHGRVFCLYIREKCLGVNVSSLQKSIPLHPAEMELSLCAFKKNKDSPKMLICHLHIYLSPGSLLQFP